MGRWRALRTAQKTLIFFLITKIFLHVMVNAFPSFRQFHQNSLIHHLVRCRVVQFGWQSDNDALRMAMPIIPLLFPQNAETLAGHCHQLLCGVTKGFVDKEGATIYGGLKMNRKIC